MSYSATVHYVILTDADIDIINGEGDSRGEGWSSVPGAAYMKAKRGVVDETNFNMIYPATRVTVEDKDAEAIWMALQNDFESWADTVEKRGVRIDRPADAREETRRSMDVGDIIVWDDGTRQTVLGCGFSAVA